MKKTYFEPSTEMVKVAVDQILMSSLNGVGGEKVNFLEEKDFDTFFGN